MAIPKGTVDELAPLILRDVEGLESGEKKGAGAYGVVFEVAVKGVPYIAKRLHDNFVNEEVSPEERTAIQQKFRQECVTLSKLKHPNIVHFVGVHYGRAPGDLSLIMEKLNADLRRCLDTKPNIPLPLKLSILLDVSYGLLYLHTMTPPIIHRDLTANNILLTSDMRAKIGDLGVSKILDFHAQVARAQTKAPGTQYYMPPDALSENPQYGVELDVFSFGHLALYTITQALPEPDDTKITSTAVKRGEVQIAKREASINIMGRDHCLYPLIMQCLQDRPERRPTTAKINQAVKSLSIRHMTHEKTKFEVLEDFARERQGLIEKIEQQQKEIEHMRRKHWQRLEETELVAQSKEDVARKFEIEKQEVQKYLAGSQEEVRAKTSQVKQYKKQVDQLKAQLDTDLEISKQENLELSSKLQKLTKENQKLTRDNLKLRTKRNSKSLDKDLPSPDQPLSPQMPLEKKLAETESLYGEERDRNKVLLDDLKRLHAQKEELYQENAELRQRLGSPSAPPLPPRTYKPSDARRRSATVPPLSSPREEHPHSPQPVEGQYMPQMVGHLDTQSQALHYKENIKQQLHLQFAQQHAVDVHCTMTELLSPGEGKLVADQHIPLVYPVPRAAGRGRLEAASQADQPVPRVTRGEVIATQADQPVPRVTRGEVIASQADQPVPRVTRGGEFAATQAGQPVPRVTRGGEFAASQHSQPVPRVTRGEEFVATQADQPVPRVTRGGEFVGSQAGQPVPRVTRGGEFAATQHSQLAEAAGGGGLGVFTQLGQPVTAGGPIATQLVPPVPLAIIDPYSQSSVGPEPSTSPPLQDYPQEEHYHSDMELHQENSLDELMPFDPNLVCPVCGRNFRMGEIQKFRRHVKHSCTET